MDIIGAMNKEREYLSFRAKGEEPYHLVDAVKEFGFESLNEYFEAKKDYEFSQLKFEIVETVAKNATDCIFATIEARKTAVLFFKVDNTIIWNGEQGDYNASYCEECNIPIYPIFTVGGTIVTGPDDLNLGICIPKIEGIDANYILNKFAKIFSKYTYSLVEVLGNDILVGGVKVLGSSGYEKDEQYMFVSSVSMSDKTELISKICKKHSTKQPGFINFMTAEQLRGEIQKWVDKHYI